MLSTNGSHRRTAPFVIASHRGFAESVPQAQHGTLLIDGIEELTVPMQLQLLQFLESGMTNGSPRLMTATGPNMFERVRSDTFSTDASRMVREEVTDHRHECDRYRRDEQEQKRLVEARLTHAREHQDSTIATTRTGSRGRSIVKTHPLSGRLRA
jgi:hypothetical protein